ncbi:MAG TPA: hypothetical protein VFI31_13050 [Pirellulales bacterium]|nr:hypothetical protein [Pirellulales bacterium]
MEARLVSTAFVAAALVSLGASPLVSLGASHRTANFIVRAANPEVAKEVGQAAEKYRRELAIEWLGKEMPTWYQPCPIVVEVGPRLGAGGATSFIFDHGDVFGWQMSIQGSRERILDSVLPHEVTHTIFASYFRRPLPRWADEGASSTVEHESERRKQQRMLIQFLQTRRGIAFNDMFAMKQYPKDILPLYAQGHSLATFLVAQGGKREFLRYVKDGLDTNDWRAATVAHYRYESLGKLQSAWLAWVRSGSPLPLTGPAGEERDPRELPEELPAELIVTNDARQQRPSASLVYHETSEDDNVALAAVTPGPIVAQSSRLKPVEQAGTVLRQWNRQAKPDAKPAPSKGRSRGQSVYAGRN